MKTHSPAQQRISAEPASKPPDTTIPEVRTNGADVARSKENILRWTSYLPDDCVRTMIEMGWDNTT